MRVPELDYKDSDSDSESGTIMEARRLSVKDLLELSLQTANREYSTPCADDIVPWRYKNIFKDALQWLEYQIQQQEEEEVDLETSLSKSLTVLTHEQRRERAISMGLTLNVWRDGRWYHLTVEKLNELKENKWAKLLVLSHEKSWGSLDPINLAL